MGNGMVVYLIRHGKTMGNSQGRYIGRTDEHVLKQELEKLAGRRGRLRELIDPDVVFVSPMLRCRETADVLFPGIGASVVQDFRECDFGIFENKTYDELKGLDEYREWLKTNGTGAFPQGEDTASFKERCVKAFFGAVGDCANTCSTAVMVVHGGVIMAVLEAIEDTHDFYRWHCGNGEGFGVELIDGRCAKVWKLCY
jgi:alpha-ribazole phosphatase